MWSSSPISLRIFWFVVIHTVNVNNEAEIDAFLEFRCLFHDPTYTWQFELWFKCKQCKQ